MLGVPERLEYLRAILGFVLGVSAALPLFIHQQLVSFVRSSLPRHLEFPPNDAIFVSFKRKNSNQGCSLIEMLEKFTEAERLDGGRVYNCSHCNNIHYNPPRGKFKFASSNFIGFARLKILFWRYELGDHIVWNA